jgi:thiamine-monophosphate kinase
MNNEIEFVSSLIQPYPKSHQQLTFPFESDAEVVKLGSQYLCISQDTVSEEISLGLIRHPETLGWLTVICSLSDLAATGVQTQGVSVVLGLPTTTLPQFESQFRHGVEQALQHHSVALEEYSVFASPHLITTCTAYALSKAPPPLTRLGLREGDILYSTGPFGWGNAVALWNVMADRLSSEIAAKIDAQYRPVPRIKEALFINKWASTCIDSSDGALFTIALMSELNQIGIHFHYDDKSIHPVALELSRKTGLPTWLFFAAQNGEFELLFSIPALKHNDFLQASLAEGFHFLRIGEVRGKSGLTFVGEKKQLPLDLSPIQNMLYEGINPEQYVLGLLNYYQQNLKE